MSAFSPMSPFAAPDQKRLLIDRLMEQYQQSASRAAGVAGATNSALRPFPAFRSGPSVLHGVAPTMLSAPRQVFLPQVHPITPFPPVLGGV